MSPVRARSIDPTGSAAGAAGTSSFEKQTQDDGGTRTDANPLDRGRADDDANHRSASGRRTRSGPSKPCSRTPPTWRPIWRSRTRPSRNASTSGRWRPRKRALGDRGIVMVDSEDPLCAAASLLQHGGLHRAGLYRAGVVPPFAGKDGPPHPRPHRRGQPAVSRPAVADLRPGIRLGAATAAGDVSGVRRALRRAR